MLGTFPRPRIHAVLFGLAAAFTSLLAAAPLTAQTAPFAALSPDYRFESKNEDLPVRLYTDTSGKLEELVSPFASPDYASEEEIVKNAQMLGQVLLDSGDKTFLTEPAFDKGKIAVNAYDKLGKLWILVVDPEKIDRSFTIPGTGISIHVFRKGDAWSISMCFNLSDGCAVCIQINKHGHDRPTEFHFDIHCGDFRFRLHCQDITRPQDCRRLW